MKIILLFLQRDPKKVVDTRYLHLNAAKITEDDSAPAGANSTELNQCHSMYEDESLDNMEIISQSFVFWET